jgi:RNA polymerase sigma-70 factor (ECF subfamily)
MVDSLLRRVARGEAAAVPECIDEFGSMVWAIARRLSPNPADAEDAVQEIFMEIWKGAARFDPERGSERAFVATIARRRLIDRLRRHSTQPEFLPTEALDTIGFALPAPHEAAIEAEQAARAVAQLAPEEQRVIEFSILNGLTHAEIATRTGLPLGTVKTHLRRGILKVRKLLGVEAIVPGERSA